MDVRYELTAIEISEDQVRDPPNYRIPTGIQYPYRAPFADAALVHGGYRNRDADLRLVQHGRIDYRLLLRRTDYRNRTDPDPLENHRRRKGVQGLSDL